VKPPEVRILAGRWKGRRLEAGSSARPTSSKARQALFSILAGRIDGARVLDLYAGSGAVGLEAVSRGALSAVLIEVDAVPLRRSVERIGAGPAEARVVEGSVGRSHTLETSLGYSITIEPGDDANELLKGFQSCKSADGVRSSVSERGRPRRESSRARSARRCALSSGASSGSISSSPTRRTRRRRTRRTSSRASRLFCATGERSFSSRIAAPRPRD